METLRDVKDKTMVDSLGRDVFKLRNGRVLREAVEPDVDKRAELAMSQLKRSLR